MNNLFNNNATKIIIHILLINKLFTLIVFYLIHSFHKKMVNLEGGGGGDEKYAPLKQGRGGG